jgi:hypothetical protein
VWKIHDDTFVDPPPSPPPSPPPPPGVSWTTWAVNGGGTGGDNLYDVAMDGLGNSVAVGQFNSPLATFGDRVLSNIGSSYAAVVVWKTTASGSTAWVVRGGGTSFDFMSGVAVDGSGDVVVTGYLQSTAATFGDTVLSTVIPGMHTAVVWKISGDGTTEWAVRGGGSGSAILNAVAVDASGGVVVTGYFQSSVATFGDKVLSGTSSTAVVWKLDSEGTTMWAVAGGGTGSDYLNGVAVDRMGNVFAVGSFCCGAVVATFGDVTLSNSAGSSSSSLVWKVSATGSTIWAIGGSGTLNGVATDNAGDMVAVGELQSAPATFGDVVLSKRGSGIIEALAWKISAQGTTVWAVNGGGTGGQDRLYSVAIDDAGGIISSGSIGMYYYGASSARATFGSVVLSVAGKGSDGFVWKMNQHGSTLWAERGGGGSDTDGNHDGDVMRGVASDGIGNIIVSGYIYQAASSPTPSTFGDAVLSSIGVADAVMWKMYDNTFVDPPPAPPPRPPPPPPPPPPPSPPPPPPGVSWTWGCTTSVGTQLTHGV